MSEPYELEYETIQKQRMGIVRHMYTWDKKCYNFSTFFPFSL